MKYVVFVPGTDVELTSGDTAEFHIYIPYDLEDRLRMESQVPETVSSMTANFAVRLAESKNDELTMYAQKNNFPEEMLMMGGESCYLASNNLSIVEFDLTPGYNVGALMDVIQEGGYVNSIDWTILTE